MKNYSGRASYVNRANVYVRFMFFAFAQSSFEELCKVIEDLFYYTMQMMISRKAYFCTCADLNN